MSHYRSGARSFPWRDTRDPYAILVSEFMLQQTQTDRVVPKYLALLAAFPTVQDLASAELADVLALWVGLGYNRRARFLHETARAIVSAHGGRVPDDAEALDALPGIGPYTARAISTFAYGRRHAFIETNIRSVFIYFFFKDLEDVSDREVLGLVEETLPDEGCRDWYYALMDYGAALKRSVENPNRRSKHYARQSRFEGSPRQARGAIVRALTAHGKADVDLIVADSGIERERIVSALETLMRDGIVAEKGGVYRIGGKT